MQLKQNQENFPHCSTKAERPHSYFCNIAREKYFKTFVPRLVNDLYRTKHKNAKHQLCIATNHIYVQKRKIIVNLHTPDICGSTIA